MNDNLDTITDAELDALFAVEVADWSRTIVFGDEVRWHDSNGDPYDCPPDFCTDANAVLPWLPKKGHGGFWTADGGYMGVRICLRDIHGIIEHDAHAPTFARAAVIALLRSKRASK